MEQLIFFALIIFFSIIESIARSRKKRAGTPRLPSEREAEETGREWRVPNRTAESSGAEATTYDLDPSYDDLDAEEADASARSRSGSEGMVPADIWEEIAGLARGRMRQLETGAEPAPPIKPAPPPKPAPRTKPAPKPVPSARDGWGKRTPKVGQAHRVHRAHVGYGTDPSSRARSEQDGLDPLASTMSADAVTVRRQLRGGRHALRQAVLLQEILGPPASMRPEPLPE